MRVLLFSLLLLSLAVGCGGESKVKVFGQVRYKGAPLPGGIVTFQPENTKFNTVAVLLDEQGNYEVTLPVGKVQVAVDNRDLQPRPAAPPVALLPTVQQAVKKVKSSASPPPASPPAKEPSAPPKPRGKYIAIPETYYTLEKSGLAFTVEQKNPKHDIELK
jgi:hypothetical protein